MHHPGQPSASRSCAATMLQGSSRGKTCLQAFERYRDEVSIYKKDSHWETIRLAAIASHLVAGKKPGEYLIAEVTPDILG